MRGLARRFRELLRRVFAPSAPTPVPARPPAPSSEPVPLRRVVLSEGVVETLFGEYAEHRRGPRGTEETGWVLLGVRENESAVGLATLPAGTQRDAGVAHVLFNSRGQDIGSRIVRQHNRRLNFLGVIHTHPGSLRHPSQGDLEGDSILVRQLRGGEGIFAIGTADGGRDCRAPSSSPNVHARGELLFSWYALASGQTDYRPLPVEVTPGPDLARALHEVWPILEENADRLDRLYRQQAGLECKVIEEPDGASLAVTVPLAEAGHQLHVVLGPEGVRYLVHQGDDLFEVDPQARSIDQGVYLLLAELAART